MTATGVASVISAAADIALVINDDGVVEDCFASVEIPDRWRGEHVADCVTDECRGKVEALLAEAGAEKPTRARQINHPVGKNELAVTYRAVRLSDAGLVLLLGRSLAPFAEMQQELIETQQTLERDYWKLRQAEGRYALLFRLVNDSLVLLDGRTGEIREANPAAERLLGRRARVGALLTAGLRNPDTLGDLLDAARSSGRTEQGVLEGGVDAPDAVELATAVAPFREEDTYYFFIRMNPLSEGTALAAAEDADELLLDVVRVMPDGILVADDRGRLLSANRGFADLVGATREAQLVGQMIGEWIGRSGVEQNVLLNSLRQGEPLRLFSTTIRNNHGVSVDVEICGVAMEKDAQYFGFVVRDVSRRAGPKRDGVGPAGHSADHLKELVGRVPLKEVVRESSDMIEKLCVEAALELTNGNRAAAAEMLGLSRQSLYVKLRRYGLGEKD